MMLFLKSSQSFLLILQKKLLRMLILEDQLQVVEVVIVLVDLVEVHVEAVVVVAAVVIKKWTFIFFEN